MSTMKRCISFLLALVMVAGLLPQSILSASAEQMTLSSGVFEPMSSTTADGLVYVVYSDHVEITGYTTNNATEFVIPAEIEGLPVTAIGDHAFHGHGNLISIDIPDSVTSIGSYAFCWCSHLSSIRIPDSITFIGDSAFTNCVNLDILSIPGSVTSIGRKAFYQCSGLKSVSIQNGVASIGDSAFSYCENLASIDIPDTVTTIGDAAFSNCGNLTSIDIPGTVASISDSAFFYCRSLIEISIPDSVKSIGTSAFAQCSSLTRINIPDGVTSIGNNAFSRCSSLRSIDIPASVISIGNGAFSYCSSMIGISVDDSNPNYSSDDKGVLFNKDKTKIFQVPALITEYALPDGFTSIDDRAFQGCANLINVIIPESVTVIGNSAFSGCSSLKNIDIPSGVTTIGHYAFSGCSNLASIEIPDGVTKIAEGTFESCSNLTDIVIPDSVNAIGIKAFSGCVALTSIVIPEGVNSIEENTFANCSSLARIDIPYGVRILGTSAFDGCSSLTSIDLPDSIMSIGYMTFHQCNSLSSIAIPDSVNKINHYAFARCYGLDSVYFNGDAPAFGQDVFWLISGVTAYYPADNTTWTEAVLNSYGSQITWIPYDPEHIHEYETVVTAPSCTEIGYTTYICACGDTYVSDEVAELGHNHVDGVCINCGGLCQHVYESNKCINCGIIGGSCGEDLFWTFALSTGTLTISGSGKMEAYEDMDAPWEEYRSQIAVLILPDGLTEIGSYAFKNTGLTSVSIPNSVTWIGDGAFVNCGNLETVDLGDGCDVRENAFYLCPVKNLELGATDYFGPGAFSGSYLESITIAADAPVFAEGAFWNCTNLKEVHFKGSAPSGVVDKGYVSSLASFRNVTWYYDCTQDGWTTSNRYKADQKTWAGYSLISENHNVVIDEAVEATCEGIGWTEGYHCSNCNEVLVAQEPIPARGHSYETVVTAPTYTEPGYTTYTCACGDSYSEVIPAILKYKVYADHVEITGYNGKPTEVVIPEKIEGLLVTSIGGGAFSYCTSLTSIVIPNSVTFIGTSAFCNCSSLVNINIPDGVTVIANNTFQNCTSLVSIAIPEGVTTIDGAAFVACFNLRSIDIPDSVTSIAGCAFQNCSSLKEITIPSGVSVINGGTFWGCSNLSNIIIPDSVTSIGKHCFVWCNSLESIYIPASVTCIEESVFYECSNLSDIYFSGDAPTFDDYAFNRATATAHYPTGNPTWTEEVKQNYGGDITWVPYGEPEEEPIIITSQPADYVGMVGDTATFTVVAEGEGLKYQWYCSTDGGVNWGTTSVTGDTQSVVFLAYRNNQLYRCVITDAEGNTVTTDAAELKAKEVSLEITGQPENYIGAVGDEASFTLVANGNGLTYEWFVSSDGGATWAKSYMTGYMSETQTAVLRPYRDGYKLYCKVSDVFGNTVNSDIVSMTVKSSEVKINSQPQSIENAAIQQMYAFTVDAEGDNLTYLWEVSTDGGATWEQSWSDGYNTDTLNIRMYQYRDGYQYRCVVTSGLKTVVVTEAATLKLQAPSVVIETSPVSVYALLYEEVAMHAAATGMDLTYQWYYSTDDGATWVENWMTGYNTDTLTFVAIPTRAALYMCKVTDGSGTSVWTEPAQMKILSAELQITSEPENFTGKVGDTASFTVAAEGEGVSYRWYLSSDGGETWSECWFDGYNTNRLSFYINASRAANQYRCVITDVAGNTVTSSTVTVVAE